MTKTMTMEWAEKIHTTKRGMAIIENHYKMLLDACLFVCREQSKVWVKESGQWVRKYLGEEAYKKLAVYA